MFTLDAGALIGGLAAGGLGYIGQRNANKANIVEAARNRDWQEKMSNTSYQRAMADMKAAGLNPMLAFMKGGSSTPSGAQSQAMQNELGTAATSAMDMRRMSSEYHKVIADTKLSESLAKAAESDAMLKNANSAESLRRAELLGYDVNKKSLISEGYGVLSSLMKKPLETGKQITEQINKADGFVSRGKDSKGLIKIYRRD